MPVFDFSSIPENEKKQDPVCTYTMFRSNEAAASPEKPILILDNSSEQWKHHAIGVFGNQNKRTNSNSGKRQQCLCRHFTDRCNDS